MRDEIREQLSALADDELSAVEHPLLLGRLQRDPELRACLGRYQLIGEVMRGSGQTVALGVAERVQRSLAGDAPVPMSSVSARHGWWKPAAGFAVAASVALVAVFTVTSLDRERNATAPALAVSNPAPNVNVRLASNPNSAVRTVSDDSGDQWNRLDPSIDKRMAGYLVNHNEYAASRGVQGVMPYVRIVGYDSGE